MPHKIISTVLIAALSAIIAAGCTKKAEQKNPAQKPVIVSTIAATPEDVPEWREVMGRTEGSSQVEIRSQVSGILKKLAYSEGASVKPGQLLFLIDPAPFEADLRAATAARAQAFAQLEQSERELERTRRLSASQAVPQKELDDAVSAEKVARAALQSADARVESSRVALSHTRITAPSAGVAGISLVNPGALVSAQSTLLATLTQKGDLKVVFSMSDRDLKDAAITRASRVEVVNASGSRLKAHLDYVSQSVDPDLGTRQFRAKLDQPERLLSGQYVRVRLQTGTEKQVFRVPQSAVLQLSDGTYAVYVLKDGKAKRTAVTVGPWNDTDWIVRSGLKPGDLVITDQILRLQDGKAAKERESGSKPTTTSGSAASASAPAA